jgi:hypothetical protein
MNFEKFKNIIFIVIMLFILHIFILSFFHYNDDIEFCKANGYDGIFHGQIRWYCIKNNTLTYLEPNCPVFSYTKKCEYKLIYTNIKGERWD